MLSWGGHCGGEGVRGERGQQENRRASVLGSAGRPTGGSAADQGVQLRSGECPTGWGKAQSHIEDEDNRTMPVNSVKHAALRDSAFRIGLVQMSCSADSEANLAKCIAGIR